MFSSDTLCSVGQSEHVPDRVEFKTAYDFPPERESRVIELYLEHDGGGLDIPVHLYREQGEVVITIFGREGDKAWVWRLDESRAALDAALVALDTPPKPRRAEP